VAGILTKESGRRAARRLINPAARFLRCCHQPGGRALFRVLFEYQNLCCAAQERSLSKAPGPQMAALLPRRLKLERGRSRSSQGACILCSFVVFVGMGGAGFVRADG